MHRSAEVERWFSNKVCVFGGGGSWVGAGWGGVGQGRSGVRMWRADVGLFK